MLCFPFLYYITKDQPFEYELAFDLIQAIRIRNTLHSSSSSKKKEKNIKYQIESVNQLIHFKLSNIQTKQICTLFFEFSYLMQESLK